MASTKTKDESDITEIQNTVRRAKKAKQRAAARSKGLHSETYSAGLAADRAAAREQRKEQSRAIRRERLNAAVTERVSQIDTSSSLLACSAMAMLLVETFIKVYTTTAEAPDGMKLSRHACIEAELAVYDRFGKEYPKKHDAFVQRILSQCRVAVAKAQHELSGNQQPAKLVKAS